MAEREITGRAADSGVSYSAETDSRMTAGPVGIGQHLQWVVRKRGLTGVREGRQLPHQIMPITCYHRVPLTQRIHEMFVGGS